MGVTEKCELRVSCKVIRHKINIGGFSNFVSGQYVDFWGKIFVKAWYASNFWAGVAHRYGAVACSIHMKKKLQGQDNIDVLKTTQKKYQCPSRLNVEIFLEIRQLSRLLMPGQTVQTD